ncbi:MAG TPA: WbqC family protein [Capillimicrobium sp.]|nr:WbqC family protein [Capillimicrobium sp.]
MAATRRVAISQSNYIPWKGYFDLIRSVDLFLLYDEVQYTRRDWRNRNRIKTPAGVRWLSIPLQAKGNYYARIDAMLIADRDWARGHWDRLRTAYREAPAFAEVEAEIRSWYREVAAAARLSDVNRALIEAVNAWLGIGTPVRFSTELDAERPEDPTARLVALCRAAEATEYVSGPAARAYLDEAAFADAGIRVRWADYGGYPEYPQLHPPFAHDVTVLDLLFHAGRDANRLMKGTVLA